MSLQLLASPEYLGEGGVLALRGIQSELTLALRDEDWDRVRHLDRICVVVIERVVAANKEDRSSLLRALSELKGVYAGLIAQCQQQVSLLVNQ